MKGEIIRKHRSEAGLTLAQVAERVGITKQWLSEAERSDNLQPETAAAILQGIHPEASVDVMPATIFIDGVALEDGSGS